MPDYKEIMHERLYVRVPGTDKLRKTAAARIKHLLANGWRETERQLHPDHVMARFERTGHAPMRARLPKAVPEVKYERRPRGQGRGGPGGPGGRGRREQPDLVDRRSFGLRRIHPDDVRLSWGPGTHPS
jgi:hypothetical protein